jgi:fibronectin-binding autotransporter adhesin
VAASSPESTGRSLTPSTLGLAAGYSHTSLSVHDGESGSLDTPRLMLYGNYALGPWSLDATAGYAHDFIDAARPIASVGETASSSHGADEATGAVQAARRFDLGGVTLLPAAGLQYVHLFDGGFSESGAPGFDLDVSRRNSDSLCPFVGMSAAKAFTTEDGLHLVPEANISQGTG